MLVVQLVVMALYQRGWSRISLSEREVFEEALAGLRGSHGGAVEIDVLALAVVGAHADDVALVGDDVDQLELPVEAADGGVALADLSCASRWKSRPAARRRTGS